MESKSSAAEESIIGLDLVPLSANPINPLKWSRRPESFQNWKRFKPSTLSSELGYHAVKLPCDDKWWDIRKKADIASPGYTIRLPDSEYIFEGGSIRQQAEAAKDLPVYNRTVVITAKRDGSIVAELDDNNKMIIFSDGARYRIVFGYWIPFKKPIRFEFFDKAGVIQFDIDSKRNIWIEKGANMKHILFLIAMERYLVDLNIAEAPGG